MLTSFFDKPKKSHEPETNFIQDLLVIVTNILEFINTCLKSTFIDFLIDFIDLFSQNIAPSPKF